MGGSLSQGNDTGQRGLDPAAASVDIAIRYPWFALQVRSRYEQTICCLLRAKGFQPMLPLYRSRRRWSDRIKEIQTPLFPGYLFCQFDPHNRLPILSTPGVIQMVGIGKQPEPIDSAEIAAIQSLAQCDLGRQPWPFLEIGQKVQIMSGPLCGLEGILIDFKGVRRVVLSVSLLRRSVAVELDSVDVNPAEKAKLVRSIDVAPSSVATLTTA
jgi:transcription antitermination factor NusG